MRGLQVERKRIVKFTKRKIQWPDDLMKRNVPLREKLQDSFKAVKRQLVSITLQWNTNFSNLLAKQKLVQKIWKVKI